MMDDWRDPRPYTVENHWPAKMATAAIVAVGFIGAGIFAFESGGLNSQPVQSVAPKTVAAQDTPQTPPVADAQPGDSAQPSLPPAEPLKNAALDNAPPQAPPAPAQSQTKPVKVARVQHEAPAQSEAQAVQAPAAAVVEQKVEAAAAPVAEVAAPEAKTAAPADPPAENSPPANDAATAASAPQ